MANIWDINYDPNHMHQPISQIRDFKSYKMFLIKNQETIPIAFGNVSWSDNIDTLGIQLNFDFPRNQLDKYVRGHDKIEVGDKLMFMNGEFEIFRGIIVEVSYSKFIKTVTAYDYGYLLNQNKLFKQFNRANSTNAIHEICRTENIPVGNISGLTASITEIYQNQSAAEIIKKIVEENEKINGIKYRVELRGGKLVIEPYSNLIIKPVVKVSAVHPTFDPTLVPGDITRTDSITDMVNKVVVTSGESKSPKIIHTSGNTGSQQRYGVFQEVVSVNKEETKRAHQIAKQILDEKSSPSTSINVKLLGDDKVRSGRVIQMNNKSFDMDGYYLIKNCNQTYNNSNRFMDLELKKVNI